MSTPPHFGAASWPTMDGESGTSPPRRLFAAATTILAPMVRINSLGFRTLCAASGADVVFSEEVVAAKLCRCTREVVQYASPAVGAIAEYVVYEPYKQAYKRTVVFATQARSESVRQGVASRGPPLVLQLGVADPDVAARAAALCADDVDGIDLNMGCPKKFSIENGFGAALMKRPALAGAIVRGVYEAVNHGDAAVRRRRAGRSIAVSLKTRLKSTTAKATVDMLCAVLHAAGHSRATPVVDAITLHARTPEQRPEEAALYRCAREVGTLCRTEHADLFDSVCLVLNGSIASRDEGVARCAELGFDAAMIARAAMWDCDCFGPGAVATDEAHCMAVLRRLLSYSITYRTPFKNFKYHLTRSIPAVAALRAFMPRVQHTLHGYADCYDLFGCSAAERDALSALEWREIDMFDTPPVPAASGVVAKLQAACVTQTSPVLVARSNDVVTGDSAAGAVECVSVCACHDAVSKGSKRARDEAGLHT